MPHLSSAAPAPEEAAARRPSGSNGGVVQSAASALGLHVVVRVQQDRRRPCGSGTLAEDRGVPAVELEQPDVG